MTQESAIGDAGEAMCLEVDGNALTLLSSGAERLEALMRLIWTAERRLDLYFYIFARDHCAMEVRDALIDACQRGVQVTLLVDAFGSSTTPDTLFAPLIEAGARFGRFGRRHSTRYLIRNHQKMAIADGNRALVGGFNVAGDYFGDDDDFLAWRDFGVLVEGPLAGQLLHWFERLAEWTLDQYQSFLALRKMVRDWQPGKGKAVWLMGGPAHHLNRWARHIKSDLQEGWHADIVAAFFSPGWSMLRRMRRLARRGTLRLVRAAHSDNSVTIGAARYLYRRLLNAGVKIVEFQPQKLHTKLIVIDDITYVGSANFDMRSLFINVELMLRIDDPAFAAAARNEVEALVLRSQDIDQAVYDAMDGPFTRARWWIDYLLVGVLDYTVTRRLNFRRDKGRD